MIRSAYGEFLHFIPTRIIVLISVDILYHAVFSTRCPEVARVANRIYIPAATLPSQKILSASYEF